MNILKIIYGMTIVALLSACTHIGVGVGFGSGNFGMGIGGTVPLPIKRPTQAVIAPSTAVERELQIELAAVNQLRAGQGLPPLYRNRSLDAYAAVRAQELAQHFAHERLDGSNPLKQIHCNAATAENIAQTYVLSGKEVFRVWRASPGHYGNMMSPNYRDTGIGAYRAPSDKVYWVQLFAGINCRSDYRFNTDL